jgi:RNA polymerase sigma-70 factor (ECF subfamily)
MKYFCKSVHRNPQKRKEAKKLTDAQIIDLYEQRNEQAIAQTQEQYGSYCLSIAMRVLHNVQDAQECVNDAYLNAWNAIPPQRPVSFASFLGKIVKNLSLNKYKSRMTQKRAGCEKNEFAVILSELENCVPAATSPNSVEEEVDMRLLKSEIERFLHTLSKNDAVLFVYRYWHNESISEISARFTLSESNVKSNLFRTRNKLRTFLKKEGVL